MFRVLNWNWLSSLCYICVRRLICVLRWRCVVRVCESACFSIFSPAPALCVSYMFSVCVVRLCLRSGIRVLRCLWLLGFMHVIRCM